ncbi:cytochrome oxidase small assembly protein [Burkholderia pseudomallei]
MSYDAGGAHPNENSHDPEFTKKRRTPDEIRAGNKRLLLILLIVVAVFFVGAVVRQWIASTS